VQPQPCCIGAPYDFNFRDLKKKSFSFVFIISDFSLIAIMVKSTLGLLYALSSIHCCLLAVIHGGQAPTIPLPALPGLNAVGTISLELIDKSRRICMSSIIQRGMLRILQDSSLNSPGNHHHLYQVGSDELTNKAHDLLVLSHDRHKTPIRVLSACKACSDRRSNFRISSWIFREYPNSNTSQCSSQRCRGPSDHSVRQDSER
jgi:hypothetical protein